MSSFTCFLPCVLYLLSIAHSAQANSQAVPRCEKELGEKAIQDHGKRFLLAAAVVNAKGQPHGPSYNCTLEGVARGLVTFPPEPAGFVGGYSGAFRSGAPNMQKIANGWRGQLMEMGRKEKFGCNYLVKDDKYKIACLYK